jgi:hypothetical protein
MPVSVKVFLILLFCLLLGLLLRFQNLSPFFIYPDSYQNLVVAENLKTSMSVVGYLGESGMLYPPFIAWSRFGYPLVLSTLSVFSLPLPHAAALTAFFFGVIALPLSFLLGKTIFKQTLCAVSSLILLTFSFNHTVWGGFILTETMGVFLVLALLLLMLGKHLPYRYFSIGILMTLCGITRYEYLILFPLLLWYLLMTKVTRQEILQVLGAFIVSSFVLFGTFFPTQNLIPILTDQLFELSQKVSLLCIVGIGGFIILKQIPEPKRDLFLTSFHTFFLTLSLMLTGISFVTALRPELFPSFQAGFGGLLDFIRHDLFLWGAFLYGYYLLRKQKTFRYLQLFVTLSLLALYSIYHTINPLMERYLTHLIPFLLIPGALGVMHILLYSKNTKQAFSLRLTVLLILLLAAIYQTTLSFGGIKSYARGSYFQTGYEQEAAEQVRRIVTDTRAILIASFPEAYFIGTGLSTQSVADHKPFLDPTRLKDTDRLLIVQDAGMRDIFPRFSRILDTKLTNYKKESFPVARYYHYADRTVLVKEPVNLYYISVPELKHILTASEE